MSRRSEKEEKEEVKEREKLSTVERRGAESLMEQVDKDAEETEDIAGDTAEKPPGGDREAGGDGEEPHGDKPNPDVVEEAETQADLWDDGEQQEEEEEEEPPVKADDLGNVTATVKVVLVPEGQVMTVAFAIGLSMQELKRHFSSELRVPQEVLQVSLDGRALEEQQSLMDLGARPHGSIRLEMSSTHPSDHPLRPLRPPEHDNMPDVITVRVQTGKGDFQEVVVEIERPPQQKAFLGGFRHRLTGAEYHHAATQTPPKRRPHRGVVAFSRDTQTVQDSSQSQQSPVSVSTQMTGIGCYISCVNDKLVAPGNYITADAYHSRRLRAAIRLQAWARRWLARRAVDQLRSRRDVRLAWMDMQERRRKEEKEEQLRDRQRRWMNPRSREDFNLLYHALEKWRLEEEQQINVSLRGAERKAALCSLLEQETELIATIGRHHIIAQNENYDKAIEKFLNKCAGPHQWRAANNRKIEVESEHTIRARALRDLYYDVNASSISREQRTDILTALKHTTQEHQSQLSRDLVELIDREVDLMTRGVKPTSLQGLRKRISTLFLQLIKTPAFNPEASRLLKVPQNPSQLKNNIFFCRGCHRYLTSADFNPSSGARTGGRCRDCSVTENIARHRDDFFCYRNILKELRANELKLNQDAKIPFLLQEEDVRYLVEVVWASRSALSGCDDLYQLVLVRWERLQDWSPWNCVLLSKEEASAHLEVEDVKQVYEDTFTCSVEHKHTLAVRHFHQIPAMADHLNNL
ncbi:IQ motif and ubiquitin-like domain-containing protein [Genypterus blacodes]|uniref:IQ motif and ubiquitin-like domain-containing protein n=1 Tax=Genypterus blacodes TaxID=154954 RepID=UPI003F76D68B